MAEVNGALITSRSTITDVCITSYENGIMTGYIHNAYYEKTIPFNDSLDLLKKMESLFDLLSFPSRFEDYRHFIEPVKKRTRRSSKERADKIMNERAADSKATFVIHVQFRQNATWQGTIQWVDENRQQSFRSTLEMIRLIDEALERGSGEPKITWAD